MDAFAIHRRGSGARDQYDCGATEDGPDRPFHRFPGRTGLRVLALAASRLGMTAQHHEAQSRRVSVPSVPSVVIVLMDHHRGDGGDEDDFVAAAVIALKMLT